MQCEGTMIRQTLGSIDARKVKIGWQLVIVRSKFVEWKLPTDSEDDCSNEVNSRFVGVAIGVGMT